MNRSKKQQIIKDLAKKMVFIAGPRQAGKTWLARDIAKDFKNPVYLNYDHFSDQQIIKNQSWLPQSDLVILDELHKMPDWKNYLKGLFDTRLPHLQILVTGSARLDIFSQIGDSLAGRFFLHRLLPFSPAELKQTAYAKDLDRFMHRSGFPEPFLVQSDDEANRWRMQYTDSLLRTDIFQFDHIQNIRAIQLVLELLRRRVGSPISYTAIAEDAHISVPTVKKYIQILEALFIIFRIQPFSKNIARSILKEPKIYFFDTGLVIGDEGAIFENFMALCLLKHVYSKIDDKGQDHQLHFFKTKEGKEVDFVLAQNESPIQMIEVKLSQQQLDHNLKYFSDRYPIPAVQVVKNLRQEYQVGQISILKAENFLVNLE